MKSETPKQAAARRAAQYGYGSLAWAEAVCSEALAEAVRQMRERRADREGGQYWLPMWLPEYRPNWPSLLSAELTAPPIAPK